MSLLRNLLIVGLVIISFEIHSSQGAISSCMVADSIRVHNSHKTLWWHSRKSRPIISSRRPRGARFNSEWMVFVSDVHYHIQRRSVIEIAQKVKDGSCRFLLHSQTGDRTAIKFSHPMRCQAGHNGEHGRYSTSFDYITDRRQITAGSGQTSEEDILFLGVRGRFLSLTTIRNPSMRWWKISFDMSQHC